MELVRAKYAIWRYTKEDVTRKRTKIFLGELNKQKPACALKYKFHKYYDYSPQISYRISGIPPNRMITSQEERMRLRFRQIQIPFEACPKEFKSKRRNFLSYSYTLWKLCQLEGYDEFLRCFPLLKSRDRIRKHDIIWQFICRWNNWEYIPSDS